MSIVGWLVSLTSLGVCLALLGLVVFSGKGGASKALAAMLLSLALWAGGFLAAWASAMPDPLFWGRVQLSGLCMLVLFSSVFAYITAGKKRLWSLVLLSALSIAAVVLGWSGIVLSAASVVSEPDGVRIIYNTGFGALLILALLAAAILMNLAVILLDRRGNAQSAPMAVLQFTGFLILLAGLAAAVIFPDAMPPVLLSCALLCSLIFFSALCLDKRQDTSLFFVRGIMPTIFALITAFLTVAVAEALSRVLPDSILLTKPILFGTLLYLFILAVVPAFGVCTRILSGLFKGENTERTRIVQDFQSKILNNLDLASVAGSMIEAAGRITGAQKTYLLLYDKKSGDYCAWHPPGYPRDNQLYLDVKNPVISLLRNRVDKGYLLTQELFHMPQGLALWDRERRFIEEKNIEAFVPIKTSDSLIGVLLISRRRDGRPCSSQELDKLANLSQLSVGAFENAHAYRSARDGADTDGLTGLYNHRYFMDYLAGEMENSCRLPISAIMLDLDNFKLYNDLYGHIQGDVALKQIAGIMKDIVGEKGVCARYGGEEFIAILPLCDSKKAYAIAESMRLEVRRQFSLGNAGTTGILTVSMGICTYPYTASNRDELLSRADASLYAAKSRGKNQTVIYTDKSVHEAINGNEGVSPQCLTTIYGLTAEVDVKDNFTFSHSHNVAHYMQRLISELDGEKYSPVLIKQIAFLHDVGKIGIPESILCKPGRLSVEEYECIKQHVEMSVKIARHLHVSDEVITTILSHHERWDGKGYPYGISGKDIPFLSRCLCIVDVFDALTSYRPYKDLLPVESALRVLEENSGIMFDPEMTKVFVRLCRRGEIAIPSLAYDALLP